MEEELPPAVTYHYELTRSGLDLSQLPGDKQFSQRETLLCAIHTGQVHLVLWCIARPEPLSHETWYDCVKTLFHSRSGHQKRIWRIWKRVWPLEVEHMYHLPLALDSLAGELKDEVIPRWIEYSREIGPSDVIFLAIRGLSKYVEMVYQKGLSTVEDWKIVWKGAHQVLSAKTFRLIRRAAGIHGPPEQDLVKSLLERSSYHVLRYLVKEYPDMRLSPERYRWLHQNRYYKPIIWAIQHGLTSREEYMEHYGLDPEEQEKKQKWDKPLKASRKVKKLLLHVRLDELEDMGPERARESILAMDRTCLNRGLHLASDKSPELALRLVRFFYQCGVPLETLVQLVLAHGNWRLCDHVLSYYDDKRMGLEHTATWARGITLIWLCQHADRLSIPVTDDVDRDDGIIVGRLHAARMREVLMAMTQFQSTGRVRGLRDVPDRYSPHLYRSYLREYWDREVRTIPNDIQRIQIYLDHCRETDSRLDNRRWSNMFENICEDKHYTREEREQVCREAVALTEDTDSTLLMVTVRHAGEAVVDMLQTLDLLPPPEDVLVHPRWIEDTLRQLRRPNRVMIDGHVHYNQRVRNVVKVLQRAYPHLHLHQFGRSVCCDLPGPMPGWNYTAPIWWLGDQPDMAEVESVWEKYRPKKSARGSRYGTAIDSDPNGRG